jgi:hypothetical protein
MKVIRTKLSICILTLLVSAPLTVNAQTSYFPPRAFDEVSRNSDFMADWYSAELKVLGEASYLNAASNPAAHSYRFTWLRTFNQPIAIRLDIKEDGSAVLTTKVANGEGGYPRSSTAIIENTSRTLTSKQVNDFLDLVDKVNFWTAPSHIPRDQTGTDGSEWIIEAVHTGKYHVVARWTPQPNQPSKSAVRELGLALAIDLAQLKIPAKEFY